MSVKWTEEQQKVIDLRDRNILVSAAAGSGKTAVLVERIIQRLTEEEHPVDVDRLLIVTFTEAAAAEMKERIGAAIEKKLMERPGDARLEQQATLVHSAAITTIHSFCLSVIRDHFHVIGIDPGFRIAEEGELKLLQQDVMDELLEECYEEGTKDFLDFVERFGTGRNDRKIEGLILKLYEYSRSYPQPNKWLDSCVRAYEMPEGGTSARAEETTGENTASADGSVMERGEAERVQRCAAEKVQSCAAEQIRHRAEERVRCRAGDVRRVLERALEICGEPDGPYMYADMLESDLEDIERLEEEQEFRGQYDIVCGFEWKRLSGKKDETVSEDKKEAVKKLREQVKKLVKDIREIYFYAPCEEWEKDMEAACPSMRTLVSLVKKFSELFSEKKRSRNMIDFNDMEQFALAILTGEKDGKLVPSPVAGEYQDRFEEVMIDEYQDSNLVQETILASVSRMSRGGYNVFMVGDVKQSIYSFRLSRPELFMEKYDTYSLADSEKQRIDLHKNFRSRPEVLDSVNYIFRQIMGRDLGGIEYDDSAALYAGADFPSLPEDAEKSGFTDRTELLLLDKADTGDEDARRAEVRMIARRIRKLMRTGMVIDRETGGYRRVQYRDIVILTRSIKGWAEDFSAVLTEEGIPAYSVSREGYFETYEVSVLLDYLKILDNARQDLPLAAALTSPFGNLSTEDMAEIRIAFPNLAFYEAAAAYAAGEKEKTEPDGTLQKKLSRFYRQTAYFREKVPYTPVHELLTEIIEETGYGLAVAAMPGGAQRTANVEMLVEKASAFEGTSYKGLFNFVRYIGQLKKYDVDYGEAGIMDEQSDTVRIMSIHKSKGLEFPIVFTAGMGKQFNMQDAKGSVLLHPEWGVGLDYIDLERRTKKPVFLKKMIREESLLETLAEEMRILYVAMTRAKEKLIMTGCADMDALTAYGNLGVFRVEGARCYLDWVLPAVLEGTEREAADAAGETDVKVKACAPVELAVFSGADLTPETSEERAEELALDVLEHWDTSRVYVPELRARLEEQMAYVYPYEDSGRMKLKFTVSELKKRSGLAEEAGQEMYEEPEVVPLLPGFLREEETLTGASRGSAYHKLLELLDFTAEYDDGSLSAAIGKLRAAGRLTGEMAECIRREDILRFLRCKSGRRMRRAASCKELFKEQPFVLSIDASEIYPQDQSGEKILVQGIIDVYFGEPDGLVVLDYKTDKVRSAGELREKYHAQLDYYARALTRLTGKPVKEKIIYSFTLGEEIAV